MKKWKLQLLNPATAPDVRATALRDHLPLESPWRAAVLRHDSRLWKLFPEECASFRTASEGHEERKSDVDGNGADSGSCSVSSGQSMGVQPSVSIPKLQALAADVCARLASYVGASSSAAASTCTDVATRETVVQALAQVRTMLRQFDEAVATHEEVAERALGVARRQRVESGERDKVDSA